MQTSRVVREAKELELPSCVSLNASIQFVDIVSSVSLAPLNRQDINGLLALLVSFLLLWVNFNPFASGVLLIALPLCVFYDLSPSMINSLILSANLPENISKVYL